MTETTTRTSFRLLTLNAWALPVAIPGQFKGARAARLPSALRSIEPDVVVLQEVFDMRVRRAVVDAMPGYHLPSDALLSRRKLGLTFDVHGGILVLSRFPIATVQFVPHPLPPRSRLSERLGRKGSVIATIATPTGSCLLVAPHFYAGTSAADSVIREAQLRSLLDHLRNVHPMVPTILAGDLNFPPTRYDDGRPSEMRLLTAAGFRDTLDSATGSESPTWSYSRNRYARNWLQTHKSDMRFDYILFRSGDGSILEPVSSSIVLDQEGREVSDHYGVMANLTLHGRQVLDGGVGTSMAQPA